MRRSYTPWVTEGLLALVWATDWLARPTLHQAVTGGRGDADWDRLRNQLRYAERRGLLQREGRAAALVYRLTESGRLATLGGRDPEERWGRSWDGQWRLILFDLPVPQQRLRRRLLRWLHQGHFGYLQQSVWVRPDPVAEPAEALAEYSDDMETLAMMEARCVAGYSNATLVQSAWDFTEINKRYAAYLEGFGRQKAFAIASGRARFAWARGWLRAERVAWDHAVGLDPLLPRALLPPGYRGLDAWRARRRWVRAVLKALTQGVPGR